MTRNPRATRDTVVGPLDVLDALAASPVEGVRHAVISSPTCGHIICVDDLATSLPSSMPL